MGRARRVSRRARVGEPLDLRIDLANSGEQPLRLATSLDPVEGWLSPWISVPDGAAERCIEAPRWVLGASVEPAPVTLAPDESATLDTFVCGTLAARVPEPTCPPVFGAVGRCQSVAR